MTREQEKNHVFFSIKTLTKGSGFDVNIFGYS